MANLTLFEKLDQIESRYDEMTREISSPEVHADSARYQKLAKTHSELGEIVAKYREWKEIEKGLKGARELLAETGDTEMKQMAYEEERALNERREVIERELRLLLVPKDPNDEKNVIVEIRAGTGGDEASLFAGELFRMYCVTPNPRAGASKFSKVRPRPSAASRKSSPPSRETRSTRS